MATAYSMASPSAESVISAYSATSSSASSLSSATATSSSAAASSSTSSNSTTSSDGKAALTPNGIKAGMTLCTGIDEFTGKLGWCYGTSPHRTLQELMKDWTPNPSPPSGMVGVSMLWGDGSSSNENDAPRLTAFKSLTTSPAYIIGFEEPDCSTTGSADMTVEACELHCPHIVPVTELIV
jgi:hypothetical protein